MIDFTGELLAPQRLALAIDVSDRGAARELAQMARGAGALVIKQGIEIFTASDLEFMAENAGKNGLEWFADLKLDDIPNTVAGALKNVLALDHRPAAVTIHTHSGVETMKAAQELAGEAGILLFGVTELTSNKPEHIAEQFRLIIENLGLDIDVSKMSADDIRDAFVNMRAAEADVAGLGGLVGAAADLAKPRFQKKHTLIPGTRSLGKDAHDQANVVTPEQAIEAGATFLVIGRQVTQAADPEAEMQALVGEVNQGLEKRRQNGRI